MLKNLIIILIITLSYSCTKFSNKKGEIKFDKKRSIELTETSLLLAGKDLPENSKLYNFSKSKFYLNYQKNIKQGWEKFQRPNIEKIKKWWKQHKHRGKLKNIFYPFSGPDIINAQVLFPDGENYYMFGLEPPGLTPQPHNDTDLQLMTGLINLKHSIGTILNLNFFKTIDMEAQITKESYSGITGVILFFLAINENKIIEIRKIAIDSNNKISNWIPSDERIDWKNPPSSKRIPGVEIIFQNKTKQIKKLQYFILNVMNWSLEKHSNNFVPYLESQGPFKTVIKSASYLMHDDKFSRIRDLVLSASKFIIQDDSGIPLRFFQQDKWKIKYHGFYDKPIGIWPNRKQDDLKEIMKIKSTGNLNFSYGYKHKVGESNILTAEKK